MNRTGSASGCCTRRGGGPSCKRTEGQKGVVSNGLIKIFFEVLDLEGGEAERVGIGRLVKISKLACQ